MNNLKKLLAALLALCMALSLCACGEANTEETEAPAQETEAVETAEPSEEATEADDGTVSYTITVVDENGNPIAGALVQMCLDSCFPGMTDAAGVATFALPEAEYKVSFLSLPEGYTYVDAEEFYFESGSTELTITLKAAQ